MNEEPTFGNKKIDEIHKEINELEDLIFRLTTGDTMNVLLKRLESLRGTFVANFPWE
jgi:hypothetical protein